MDTQTQVKRTLSQALDRVRGLLERTTFRHRTEVAEAVCAAFGFTDARGVPQRGTCLKALRELAAAGALTLPPPTRRSGPKAPRRLGTPVPVPEAVPAEVGDVQGLRLELVTTPAHLRLWNELMVREHPRGAGPLVGRQLRYLIGSAHGWLGGLGFGAAALQLAARDRWIGWDVPQRRAHLHRVVGLGRFLIRPSVRGHNLASRVLRLALAALPQDFAARYGYRPWLVETFVDVRQVAGTCFRAANWRRVGQTQGRGRQDRGRRAAETVKDIYLYPLGRDFWVQLGLPADGGRGPRGPTEGLDGAAWAAQEFGGAPLGDARLSRRLVQSAGAQAARPGRAFSGAAQGDWPAVKGYYRLIDHPDATAVTMAAILQPHRAQTLRRMQGQRMVLCVHDGSELDYAGLAACAGLGVIGTNQTGAQSRGLYLHSTLAVTAAGLPLGVLRAACTAPTPKPAQDDRPTYAVPVEEKETFCWIQAQRDCAAVAAEMPQTRLLSVMDREADFFELFDEQRRQPRVDLLVRAKYDRNLRTAPGKLFAAVRQAPVQTHVQVQIPRQSARPKRAKRQARPARPGRPAVLAVRYRAVHLRPPPYHKDKAPIALWVIHAVEEHPPPGTAPVEWFLLTTLAIAAPEDAVQCLRWYCLRWRIEDWHRVLKSGCRIEALAHETAERLQRAIAINLVIAWRIMLLTLLGRETPDLPAEVLFSDVELRILRAYAKKNACRPPGG
ncbi:MAG TPA: IS4 family transposase [Methylomirabilota bacterium]|nr:IS4 family transposase [Methylomirabilota bacterium]